MMLGTKRAQAAVTPSGNGEFDMLLSNAALDRDGEVLRPEDWAQPLPKSISISINHSPDVSDVVGSGTPFLDEQGNLRVKGTFTSTPEAQHIRTLVNEGHMTSVSVEFLRKDHNGRTVNELVAGSFVTLPANTEAKVLASKGALTFDAFTALADGLATKAADSPDGMALLQAIHDASAHLGAACMQAPDDDDDEDYDDGASDGANVRATALRLRLKALRL
jgi:hypothetical protein